MSSLIDEIHFSSDPSAAKLSVLDNYASIEISGPDAGKFLQGQLTADIESLRVGQATPAAHCNPKGRVISSFLVYRFDEERFVLRCKSSLLSLAEQALKKYIVFSKASITSKPQLIHLSVWGQDVAEVKAKLLANTTGLSLFQIDPQQLDLCIDPEFLEQIKGLLGACQKTTEANWHSQRIQSGLIDIEEKTSELYLPQELNYDHVGAVSFSKGCYTGQEVVARLHYKGKLKKRLRLGIVINRNISINSQIFDEVTQSSCGIVLDTAASEPDSSYLLTLVADESVENNRCVTALAEGAKIQWLDLPYAIT